MIARRLVISLVLTALVSLGVIAGTGVEAAAGEQAFTLTSLKHETVGATTRILIESSAPPLYTVFRPSGRLIIVDLPGGESAGLAPEYSVKNSLVDSITVRRTGSDDVIVQINGTSRQFDMDNFPGGVRLEGFGGNDRITIVDSLNSPVQRRVTINGGAGNDTLIGNDGNDSLLPALTHGYGPQLITRLGRLSPEDENATTAAWRTRSAQIVDGALAAPMLTSEGCTGVLAIELKQGRERDQVTQAVARIIAAQLASTISPAAAVSRSAAGGAQ
jgi:Ca2+-binding RTX toxin-like protein